MLKLEDFKAAKKRVDEVIDETRLIHSEAFSNECGNDVYIKPENLQKTGAFKIRGAYNKIIKLDDDAKMKGLIASSAGNHAQGVAYAARKLGVKATICMPAHTPLIKVEATKAHGAEVVLHGEVYDEAYAKAVELQKKEGYTFIHPFDDEDIIEGQGTIALEILEELPDTDVILVPIGGGGLIAGIACAAKQINPNVKIYGVEPEGAASALAAIHEDQVVTLAEANTIADGTAVKTIGSKTFEYIKKYVDGIITVNDYELMDAFLLLVEKHKLVAEGSGILSLAGLKKLYEKRKARVRTALKAAANGKMRLSVFRSGKHIYAQVIDDAKGATVASASTLDKEVRANITKSSNIEAAQYVGKVVAERAVKNGVSEVVFDRGGYVYHGRVKALADSAREAGLKF